MGLLSAGFAIASVVQGHGTFSGAIGVALGILGVGMIVAAWGLWRGSVLARGPVIATGILAVIVAVSMAAAAPLAWVVAAVAAVTVVAVALPSTSAGLRWTGKLSSPGGHRQTDEPGS